MFSVQTGRAGQVVAASLFAGVLFAAPVRADTPVAAPAPAVQPVSVQPVLPIVTTPQMRATAEQKLDQVEALYDHVGEGEASYYGHELAGNRTASGERFNPNELTAAHRTLPLGSKLRVTNQRNGKSVVVRVNDRGPFTHRRVLDLSLAAAKRIDMFHAGKAQVRMELLR